MFLHLSRLWCVVAATSAIVACGHTDPSTSHDYSPTGPFSDGLPTRLTFDRGDDVFATWTDDGNGILYSFQPPNRTDRDRCLGVLPPQGGVRQFELCEHRMAFADSTDFVASGALAADGRLLYSQATSRTNAQLLGATRLYVSDTSSRSASRLLLTLPINFGATFANWLVAMRWTGADTFIALAQQFTVTPVGAGAARDTSFVPVGVVRGTINAQGAALSLIAGSEGAGNYSLIEGGTALLFSRGGLAIWRVPIAGGVPAIAVDVLLGPLGGSGAIVGLSCRATTCLALVRQSPGGAYRLLHVEVSTNVQREVPLAAIPGASALTALHLSPTADLTVVSAIVGGRGELYLYKGLLQ